MAKRKRADRNRDKAIELAKSMALLTKGHEAIDIFDACTAILAANDIVAGVPQWTLVHGSSKVRMEVDYMAQTSDAFSRANGRFATLVDLMSIRAHDLLCDVNAERLKGLN